MSRNYKLEYIDKEGKYHTASYKIYGMGLLRFKDASFYGAKQAVLSQKTWLVVAGAPFIKP